LIKNLKNGTNTKVVREMSDPEVDQEATNQGQDPNQDQSQSQRKML